ncbi:MAG: hypothetical protein GQF41_3739 [Candidatus Rifleibacterium amylolyticum]|nr:MAG: hypothetical protein GQF41_3739 [Candidatus Rifleibacterium amylolyticum]
MKLLKLTLVMILSLAMLTGCGGGGGSSNPVAPTADPLADYPTIAASYDTVETNMLDNDGDVTTRINNFMANISAEFKNIAGDANKFNELKSVTKSRLERYDFNKYTMTPTSHTVVDNNTVKVVTTIVVNVELKPGAVGNAPENTDIYLENISITWKNESGTWRIVQGLPYTSSEYWGLND